MKDNEGLYALGSWNFNKNDTGKIIHHPDDEDSNDVWNVGKLTPSPKTRKTDIVKVKIVPVLKYHAMKISRSFVERLDAFLVSALVIDINIWVFAVTQLDSNALGGVFASNRSENDLRGLRDCEATHSSKWY